MEEINENMPGSIEEQQNKPNCSSSSQQQPANQVDDQPGPRMPILVRRMFMLQDLEKFLEKKMAKSEDLTTVLNFKRGESGFTILCMQYRVRLWMKQVIVLWVFFLKAGADFSTKNDRGQTPLHYAATGYDSMVSRIKAGAHSNIRIIERRVVFHNAAGIDSDGEAIELLVKKGAKSYLISKEKPRYKLRLIMVATMMLQFALVIKTG
ncbi:hypothetical protein TNIN_149291 [Trichonephila inaurata madagascariensis]|uniref:Uncharacterized protein n=1 Tax=Trichonephila inaurata madagascariensis TaxID=2747483 RepID=A0A8X7CHL0_9ARAC|nr:hypothetical protein TNIN_149291 [Trichonephila inaurata madagascariensis]